MNAQRERGSDSENFGERITEFRVVVEKLGRFEVPEAFLQIFREKSENWIFWIIFGWKNPWSRSTGLWTVGRPVHRGPAAIAAHGSSSELGLRSLRCLRAPAKGRGRGTKGLRGHRGLGGGGGVSHQWRRVQQWWRPAIEGEAAA
jgi:hypothetical protein